MVTEGIETRALIQECSEMKLVALGLWAVFLDGFCKLGDVMVREVVD